MRRNDKEILDPKEIEGILQEGILCSIAFTDGTEPYLITVNYGYRDGCIYFHSAKEGKKMDMIAKYPKVCFQVIVDDELVKGEKTCSDFTMKYRSVVGYGRISLLQTEEEKSDGLNVLMEQHTGQGEHVFEKNSLRETAVLRIDIESMTGKKS
ncbi:MAG: pyridoxamine 5'-phosphate oxidase family protein [Bacteroidales bacterium]|nr:pyridoxamine 5'-phosphate oxidase family protein [Bacteroidales bacterium]